MYRKHLYALIVIGAAIRIITACTLELGNDEVYYYTYALHFQSNYFDHPAGVALMIRMFTFNLALQQEVFVRMGSIVFVALGTILSFKIGTQLRNERTGWYAALLYNTSLYSSIICGIFVLPDSPQIVFWLSSIYLLLYMLNKTKAGVRISILTWITFGIINGLCIMCKVHGIFIWMGLVLYALLNERKLFNSRGFYVAILLTGFVISPIILWNYQNHFATWNYHSNRVEGTHFDKESFIQTVFGQMFYNNPVNVILTIISIINFSKTKLTFSSNYFKLLLCCGLPMIILVSLMSMFNTVLPHWSGPGFLSLSFIAAVYLDDRVSLKIADSFPSVLKFSMGLILILIISGTLIINFFPGTIGNKNKDTYGEYDFTLDMYGWKKFDSDFNNWCNKEEKLHVFSPDIKIVCNKWFPASHIEYYISKPINSYVIGLGTLNDLHHFIWLNRYHPPLKPQENALCIIPSNYSSDPSICYRNYFGKITLLNIFTETRSGSPCRYFKVYLLQSFRENISN